MVVNDFYVIHRGGPSVAEAVEVSFLGAHEQSHVRHVLGIEFAKLGVEYHPFPQVHSPTLAIWRHFPARGQHRHEFAGVGVDVEERLDHGAQLGEQASGTDPGEVGFLGRNCERYPEAAHGGLG